MNYKNMRYVVSMIVALPLMMNGMNCALALPKNKLFFPQTNLTRRLCSSNPGGKLLNTMERYFTLDDTRIVIHKTVPKDMSRIDTYELMDGIVHKAVEDREMEAKCANVLGQLRDHINFEAYSKILTYDQDMIHLAVMRNLSRVTSRLLTFNKRWVESRDVESRIPVHYAKSREVALILLHAGSNVNMQDRHGDAPLHLCSADVAEVLLDFGAHTHVKSMKDIYTGDRGFLYKTPLRQAVCDGDLQKVVVITKRVYFEQDEYEVLNYLAEWQRKRTGNIVFSQIKKLLDNASLNSMTFTKRFAE